MANKTVSAGSKELSTSLNTSEAIEEFMQQQNDLDLLRFITCGSVDDGKSTLIGCLLYEAKCIFDDQVASLKQESITYGTQGGDIDFALLVDGLAAEREQGIPLMWPIAFLIRTNVSLLSPTPQDTNNIPATWSLGLLMQTLL